VPTSPSTRYGEVDFIIRNQVDGIALIRGICHVSKGKKDGKFSNKILPINETSLKVKTSLLSAGTIECCLVYELVYQRNEIDPVMRYYRVFVAVRVFARPFTASYTASVVMFRAERGRFTGKEDDIKRLHKRFYESTWSTIHIHLHTLSGVRH
jgi:hypothetical protein